MTSCIDMWLVLTRFIETWLVLTRFILYIQFQIDFDVDLDKIFDGLTFTESLGFYTCLHQLKQNLDVATYCNFMKELLKNSQKTTTTNSDENSNSIIVNDSVNISESKNSSILTENGVIVQ